MQFARPVCGSDVPVDIGKPREKDYAEQCEPAPAAAFDGTKQHEGDRQCKACDHEEYGHPLPAAGCARHAPWGFGSLVARPNDQVLGKTQVGPERRQR